MLRYVTLLTIATFVSTSQAERPIFSGPQIGEPLPAFSAESVSGKNRGEMVDFIKEVSDGPMMIVFFHERTRPAFGLTNAIAKFANTRKDPAIKSAVVFLTEDPTEMRKWTKNVAKHFSPNTTYAFSPDGKEGPGKYGLNRNVQLTVLVGDQGKVTGNFAIVQPQLQVDGPKIMKAIVDATGGGEVPDISVLTQGGARMRAKRSEKK
ncbi:hypothetical protein [Planctomycetes bacterium K23_9]|uniref:Thioredoxin domain-containing protein n=1 Tax=Stieleria marina TaxID=1930275 RepID=A0A517NSI9_9BACT|nr:hypothetical protein K239x_20290 [Planctomycetes bacterium K23_9]